MIYWLTRCQRRVIVFFPKYIGLVQDLGRKLTWQLIATEIRATKEKAKACGEFSEGIFYYCCDCSVSSRVYMSLSLQSVK